MERGHAGNNPDTALFTATPSLFLIRNRWSNLMKNIAIALGSLAVALLAGCAPISPAQKLAMSDANFPSIREGQSRDDVLRQMGKPEGQIVFSRTGEEVWDYRYNTTRHMLLSVHFGADT